MSVSVEYDQHNSRSPLSRDGQSKILSLHPLCTCCTVLIADQVCGSHTNSCWAYLLMSTLPTSSLQCVGAMSFPHPVLAQLFLTRVLGSVWTPAEFYWLDTFHRNLCLQTVRVFLSPWVCCPIYVLSVLLCIICRYVEKGLFPLRKWETFWSAAQFLQLSELFWKEITLLGACFPICIRRDLNRWSIDFLQLYALMLSPLYRNKYPYCQSWFITLKASVGTF